MKISKYEPIKQYCIERMEALKDFPHNGNAYDELQRLIALIERIEENEQMIAQKLGILI